MEQNLHKGHRERLRSEFLSYSDPTKMPEHKLLEMLLFYGIPQRDTNEIAHELIRRFGTFHAVFEADVTELTSVKGMTRNAAALIKLMMPLAKRYIASKYDDNVQLKTTEDIGSFVLKKYFAESTEKCSLLCLNHSGKVLSFDVLAQGDIESVGLSIRSVVERAVSVGATDVVLVHNHPGGIPLPSPSDVTMTEAISNALRTIEIRFADHIIIADDDYVSMANSSKYEGLFDR